MEIFTYMDDSGKLNKNEKVSIYAGIVFFSKKEKDKFINFYRSINNDIKCKYCKNKCTICPEIKNINITKSDKRRIFNLLKKYYMIGVIIDNNKVYDYIKKDKYAKRRFIEYSIKRLIKDYLIDLINKEIINKNDIITIILNMDQETSKSNAYYNLKEGIYEELKYGINNFNYQSSFRPILKNLKEIKFSYQNSKHSYGVQAADLIAGTLRKENLHEIVGSNIVKFYIIMP